MNRQVQVLRGIAIIAVVMIHTAPSGMKEVFLRPFINFAVPLFIFLSGYLTKLEIKSFGPFYKKRLSKVLIPYCIWSIVFTVVLGNYNDFIVNFLTARCCPIYYYIFVYAQLVILTPIIIKIIKSNIRWIGWFLMPMAIIIVRYIMPFYNADVSVLIIRIPFFMWFGYYYLGMILGNGILKCTIDSKRLYILYGITILISIAEGIFWCQYGNSDMATSQLRLSSMLNSTVVLLIANKYLNENRKKLYCIEDLLVQIGNNSFGIYLTHMLILIILRKFTFFNVLFFPFTTILTFVISVICAITGHKILKKMPGFSEYRALYFISVEEIENNYYCSNKNFIKKIEMENVDE